MCACVHVCGDQKKLVASIQLRCDGVIDGEIDLDIDLTIAPQLDGSYTLFLVATNAAGHQYHLALKSTGLIIPGVTAGDSGRGGGLGGGGGASGSGSGAANEGLRASEVATGPS